MKMFLKKIRTSIGRIFLAADSKKVNRTKKAMSLDQVASILLLVEIRTQDDIELVKKYINQMKELQKKIKIVGYFDSAEPVDFNYSKVDFDLFNQKDLSTWMKPQGFLSESLVLETPDLLLDLNVNDKFPLTYIAAMSLAKFKVGKTSQSNAVTHDLTISIESNNSIDYLYNQVLVFLKMINSK